jgi:predicted 3-demethylubiquinone-9 3-methyltransferase (glyoxalase superfamily)
MTPIIPCLAFADAERTEDAVRFYINLFRAVFGVAEEVGRTVFSEAEIETLKRLHGPPQEQLPGPAGTVTTIRFHLNGSELLALNGGAYFGQFHETFSLYVQCQTQAQIDRLHAPSSDGGQRQDPIDHHLFGRLMRDVRVLSRSRPSPPFLGEAFLPAPDAGIGRVALPTRTRQEAGCRSAPEPARRCLAAPAGGRDDRPGGAGAQPPVRWSCARRRRGTSRRDRDTTSPATRACGR